MTAPAACQGFDTMPIAGEWRPGGSGRTRADTDPWSGDTLTEIPLASAEDLDSAFRAASAAQREWAAQPPVARAGVMRAGDPADPATDIGPVINRSQLEAISEKLARARGEGAQQVPGGEPGGPAGLLLPPHVLLAGNDVTTAREEVFGPAITVVRASGEEEALRIANDTEYGLSSAVFTRDADRGARFALRIDAGMTHVNDSPVNDDANTAFGGTKASGIGRFGGPWAVDEFTTDHWVSVQHEPRSFPI